MMVRKWEIEAPGFLRHTQPEELSVVADPWNLKLKPVTLTGIPLDVPRPKLEGKLWLDQLPPL